MTEGSPLTAAVPAAAQHLADGSSAAHRQQVAVKVLGHADGARLAVPLHPQPRQRLHRQVGGQAGAPGAAGQRQHPTQQQALLILLLMLPRLGCRHYHQQRNSTHPRLPTPTLCTTPGMHRLSLTSSYVVRAPISTLAVPFLSTSTARKEKIGVTSCSP